MKIIDDFKRFLSGSDSKALMNNDVEVDIKSSKTQTSGTGQTGKIKAKNVSIDNSTHNYYTITIPSNGKLPDELKTLIEKQFNEGKIQFVSQPSDNDLEEYNQFEKESPDKLDIIDFFKDKLSPKDLQCLRTGLYIKQLQTKDKQKAIQIKDRATLQGGQRTRNVINMASAGYFKSYIRPIFENRTHEEALREYEEIANYLPENIFVNKGMSKQKILTAVENKISEKEKYHLQVKKITINGLGTCADTIKKTKKNLEERFPNYEILLDTKESNNLKQTKLTINLYPSIG